MLLKVFLLSMLIIQINSNPVCRYLMLGRSYSCYLTIDNPIGLDSFTKIDGVHLAGKSNSDVVLLEIDPETQSLSRNIPSIFCSTFLNLEIFRMTNSKIQEIGTNSFRFCANLKWIEISNNNFTHIAANAFDWSREVESLSISSSNLSKLSDGIFSYMFNLVLLSMSFNNFEVIPINWFGAKQRLLYLNLNYNQVNAIDERILTHGIVDEIQLVRNKCFDGVGNKTNLTPCFQNY